jgi:hypothetical protein
MKKEIALHKIPENSSKSLKRMVAIGLIVFIVFLSLPNFCGSHNHDDVSTNIYHTSL